MLVGRFEIWTWGFLAQVLVLLHHCWLLPPDVSADGQIGALTCANLWIFAQVPSAACKRRWSLWEGKWTETCVWCLGCCACFLWFISWEVENVPWLWALNSSLPRLLLSSFMFRKQEDAGELWAHGYVPFIIYPGKCFITGAPKHLTKKASISLVPGRLWGGQMVAVFFFTWTETQMSQRVWRKLKLRVLQ